MCCLQSKDYKWYRCWYRGSCCVVRSQNVTRGLAAFRSLDFDFQTTSEIALGKIWGPSPFCNPSPIVCEIWDYFRVWIIQHFVIFEASFSLEIQLISFLVTCLCLFPFSRLYGLDFKTSDLANQTLWFQSWPGSLCFSSVALRLGVLTCPSS